MSLNQVTIDIDGYEYTGWESLELNDDLEQLGNDFTLTTNIPANITETLHKGQAIIISIDGEKALTGYIDKVSITESAESSLMTVTGRDKTSDFVDSRLSNKTFTPPIGFEQIFKKLLTEVGYEVVSPNSISNPIAEELGTNKISIINNYGAIQDFQTNEGIGFNSSESAYDLIRRLADKRGIILGTNGDGNITIDEIGAIQTETVLQRFLDDSTTGTLKNNIKTATYNDSMADRFHEYKIASKGTGGTNSSLVFTDKDKPVDAKNKLDPINNDLIKYSATVYDEDIRPSRKFYAVVPNLNNAQCLDRAKWELNIRKAKDFTYTCTVAGFRQNSIAPYGAYSINPLWAANTKVYLVDERYNLQGEYLIRAVRYKQSVSEGAICELTLVDEFAYTYSTYKPLIKRGKKSTNKDLLFTDPV